MAEKDPRSRALRLAIETNLWAMHVDFARVPGSEVHDGSTLLWYSVPSKSSWLNGASRTLVRADQADRSIQAVVTELASRGRPTKWHTGPSTRPRDLPRRLVEAGFKVTDDEIPGMAAVIDELNRPPNPPGLTIAPARTEADLDVWLATFNRAFAIPPRDGEHSWRFAFSHLGLSPTAPCVFFIGRHDGVPVATSIGFIGGGAVGIYGVGTVPEARGRGYGSHLTLAVADWGAKRAADLAILHASELGFPVYRRLGFRALCTVSQFLRLLPES